MSSSSECTLAAFLLHPCSIKVMGCFDNSNSSSGVQHEEGEQMMVTNDESASGTCDMHYQCNDQFMDILMMTSSEGQPAGAHHHSSSGDDHTIVETPRVQSASWMSKAANQDVALSSKDLHVSTCLCCCHEL